MERRRASEHVVYDDQTSEEARRSRNRAALSARSSRPELGAYWREEEAAAVDAAVDAASSKAMMRLRVPAAGETREPGCAVCLDDFEAGDRLRTMPCSHSFHQRCIFRWLRLSRVCRFSLPSSSVSEQRALDRQAATAAQPQPDWI